MGHENKNINESIFASNIFSQQPKDKPITITSEKVCWSQRNVLSQ